MDGVGDCSLVGTEPHRHDERLVLLCLEVLLVCWALEGAALVLAGLTFQQLLTLVLRLKRTQLDED